MAKIAAFDYAKMLGDLIGRRVAVANATHPPATGKQVVSVYRVEPAGYPIALRVDLALLGSLGGTMVGLPDGVVRQTLTATPLDEMLRDAMHEVLNVLSSLVTEEGRAVLKEVYFDAGPAESVYKTHLQRSHYVTAYEVTVTGYQGGALTLLTPTAPEST